MADNGDSAALVILGDALAAEGEFGKAITLATSSRFGIRGACFHYSCQVEWVATVYMGVWLRQVFEKIGLFDEEMVCNQDDELNYRLLKHRGKILLSTQIKSTYSVRASPQKLWKQYYK